MDRINGLLLTCLRNDRPEIKIANLRSYNDSDWEAILRAASSFKTAPLLFHSLKPLFPDLNVPAAIRQKLEEIYYVSAARNIRLYQQLLKTLAVFNSQGVSIILLKGAHLAESVYGNFALRPMTDVDLLAKSDDLAMINKLLIEQEYEPLEQDMGTSQAHLPPYRKENAINIEVHFNIVTPPLTERFDVAQLWERAHLKSIQGVEVLTLCPEDLLLHLCVHASINHGFDNGIMPFVDISQTIEYNRGKLDWEQVLIRSRQWGLSRCVYLMLSLTEKMIGLSVPERILREVKPDDQALDALTIAEELVFGRGAPISINIARLFSQESFRHKLKHFIMRAFPPKETMYIAEQQATNRNPFSLYPMYFSRIKNLFKRHGKTVWSALLKNKDTAASLEIQNKRNNLKNWLMQTK